MGGCEDNEKVMRTLFEYDARMQAEERKRYEKINIPDDILKEAIKQVLMEEEIPFT